MITFFVFALIFSAVSAQTTTYFAGCTTFSNCSWHYPEHWTNGVPTENSIVVINATGCNACDIEILEDVTVSELHLIAGTSRTGPYLEIYKKLSVTDKFVVGSPETSSYCSFITFYSPTAELFLGGETTFYYCYTDIWDTATTDDFGVITNNGTITVLPVTGQTTFGEFSFNDNNIAFINDGNWVVTDPLAGVEFYSLQYYSHHSGWYNTTWQAGTTSSYYESTMYWYDTDFWIQSTDIAFNGPVHFYSFYTNYYYSDNALTSYISRVIFNASDIHVSWAHFERTNVYFMYSATISNSNFTYATLNGSDVTVMLDGEIIGDSLISSAQDGGRLTVEVTKGSTFSGTSSFSLWGDVYFLNYGTMTDIGFTAYIDIASAVVNLGLIELNNDYISFYPNYLLPTSSGVGLVVNKGTIQFTDSSYITWQYDGIFRQCESSWIKIGFGFPEATDTFGYMSFSEPYLDGYIAPYYAEGYSLTSYLLLSYDESKFADSENIFQGDLDTWSTFEDITEYEKQEVCILASSGYAYTYANSYFSCKDLNYEDDIPDLPDGKDACTDLPDDIKELVSECPISAKCGSLPNDVPIGETGSASGLHASLVLLVSTLAVLFFKY